MVHMVHSLLTVGIVVLNNAVLPSLKKKANVRLMFSHLDKLNERMCIDLMDMLEKKQVYEVPGLLL